MKKTNVDKEQVWLVVGLCLVIALLVATVLFFAFGTVTIEFNTDGGSKVEYIRIIKGKSTKLPSTTKDGYEFAGWFNGDEKVTNETIFGENTTLMAVWSKRLETYVVTFNSNGGSDTPALILTEGDPVTLPTVTRKGYKFVSWLDDNGVAVNNGDILSPNNITLTAKWKKKK